MKAILRNNLALKLLSVILAFILWIIVMGISNPTVSRSKTVTVEVENEEIIFDAAKVYEIIGSSSITVDYTVRSRDEYKIRGTDFRAYIDLAQLYDITGSVQVNVEVLNNRDLFIGNPTARPGVLRVKTEDVQRKGFELETRTNGTPKEGMSVGEISLEPSIVYVSGSESLIGRISSVGVEIDVEGAGEDMEGTTVPVFYDANHNRIDLNDSEYSLEPKEISYRATILRGKSLGLSFSVEGTVAEGYRFVGAQSNTKSISVQGQSEDLADVHMVEIPGSLLNIDGATEDKTIVFDVSEYLPPGLSVNGEGQVSVTLKVEALNRRSYPFSLSEMEMEGEKEGLHYRLSPERVILVVSGLKDELEVLEKSALGVTIDLTDLEPGVHAGVLQFVLPEGIALESYTPFSLVITAPDRETESETEDEESTETEETSASSSAPSNSSSLSPSSSFSSSPASSSLSPSQTASQGRETTEPYPVYTTENPSEPIAAPR